MIIKSIKHFKHSKYRDKKILAIDFGEKKLGFAHSDFGQVIATPLKTYYRKDLEFDLVSIRNILISLSADVILLGLPLSPEGTYLQSAQKVKSFANILNDNLDVDIFFWDERFSTKQAQKILQESGMSGKEADQKDDMIAASIILNSFLEYSRADKE
ncbi:MAG: Holliday junction resolvase RuvX [Rickettsiales bacterium]|jgi:putative holliday junction resolvase|nr:Holliday junction resolvase RuvX [Rickettsiales bacterium]